MNLLKKFALLGLVAPLLFSLLSFNAYSKIEEKEFVIIRVQEAQVMASGAALSSHILISEKGKIREIELEKYGKLENNKKNLEIISSLLNQYFKDGYKIENSSSISGSAPGVGLTTYILTK